MRTKMKAGRVVGALLASLALSAALHSGAPASAAVDLSCGDRITADTTLRSDVVNCPNNGIVIGADDVTLDLNGHTVAGNGEPVGRCRKGKFCDTGLLNDGHDGVTVRNGSVREFGTGVFVGEARRNRVLRIATSTNLYFGIIVADSARSLVRDSSGTGNLGSDGDGMGVFGSRHVRILDNSFERNAQIGIHVVDSTENLIEGNRFSRNSDFAILMEGDRNQVRRNRCIRNRACINIATGSRNLIARNRVSGGGNGISIEKGRGNLIALNVIVSPRRAGIYLGLREPAIGGAYNVVRRNTVRGSASDGFRINDEDDHSLLKGNLASGARDDGFDVESDSTRLTGNRAVRNADLGIEAASGAIDGGRNKAYRNGNPLQCTNVFCR